MNKKLVVVPALVSFEIPVVVEEDCPVESLEGFAFVNGSSLVIEDVFKTFNLYNAKGQEKVIPTKHLRKVYLNEDALSLILSYHKCEVHFALTECVDNSWKCVASEVKHHWL